MKNLNYEDAAAKIERHFASLTEKEFEANLQKAGINEYPLKVESIFLTYLVSKDSFILDTPISFREVSTADTYNSDYLLAA